MPLLRKFVASIVICASIYWLGQSFIQHGAQLHNWRPTTNALLMLAVCSLIYGCNGFLLSSAWWRLLVIHGSTENDRLLCHIIYSRTQIAKYLPGNVFHFAGRYTLGRDAGISKLALIGSTFYETFGVLFAAGAFSLAGILFYRQTGIQALSIAKPSIDLVLLLGILFTLIVIVHKIARSRGIVYKKKQVLQLISVGTIYVAFFLVFGVIACMVVGITTTVKMGDLVLIVTAFSIAWVAGFVTPGAPAGLGVREVTLVLLLSPLLGEVASLLSALLFRLVTMTGDLLFFLASFILSYRRSGNGPDLA